MLYIIINVGVIAKPRTRQHVNKMNDTFKEYNMKINIRITS